VANHIVGAVETPASVVVHQRFYFAVRIHPCETPVIALAHDEAALQVEGRAVATDGVPDDFWLFSRGQAKELVLADIDEVPIARRMPGWAFSKDKSGGEALRVSGFKHVGQIIGCGHGALLASPPRILEIASLRLLRRHHPELLRRRQDRQAFDRPGGFTVDADERLTDQGNPLELAVEVGLKDVRRC
jgi:hypothetical protein